MGDEREAQMTRVSEWRPFVLGGKVATFRCDRCGREVTANLAPKRCPYCTREVTGPGQP